MSNGDKRGKRRNPSQRNLCVKDIVDNATDRDESKKGISHGSDGCRGGRMTWDGIRFQLRESTLRHKVYCSFPRILSERSRGVWGVGLERPST